MKLRVSNLLLIALLFPLLGCGVYGFTGASISPETKTISIQTFFNNAVLGPSNMSVLFTERIKDYYQQNTNLALVDDNGDLQVDGYIADYKITPVAANSSRNSSGQDLSALSRVTITVFASYINVNDDTFDFEKRFSFFVDFDQSLDLSANEQAFVEEIFDQIVIDIFNASVANW